MPKFDFSAKGYFWLCVVPLAIAITGIFLDIIIDPDSHNEFVIVFYLLSGIVVGSMVALILQKENPRFGQSLMVEK